jgi:cation diffusion facilitator family transporter
MTNEKKDRVLIRASWVSTIGNAVLSAVKIGVGLLAGSIAVVGDGIDSATDVVISIVMVITAHIMNRPPSRKYPYGFQKAEVIATKILSLVIFYAGVQMIVSSVSMMFSGEERELPAMVAIYATIFSIVGKLALAWYQFLTGRRTGSPMLIANAKNMRTDVIISGAVLLGLFFTFTLKLPVLDAVTGFIVGLFILRTAVEIFMESNIELMDGVKDESVYHKIFEAVERVPEAGNPHRVRSRLIGGRYMIDLDIEADGSISLDHAHRIAEQVERSIKDSIDNIYDIVVHVEPAGKCHEEERFGVTRDMM